MDANMVPLWDALLTIGINVLAVMLIVVVWWFWRQAQKREDTASVVALVKAAEQILADGTGGDKLAWVMAQAKVFVPRLNTSLVRVLVEAAVHDMKQGE